MASAGGSVQDASFAAAVLSLELECRAGFLWKLGGKVVEAGRKQQESCCRPNGLIGPARSLARSMQDPLGRVRLAQLLLQS